MIRTLGENGDLPANTLLDAMLLGLPIVGDEAKQKQLIAAFYAGQSRTDSEAVCERFIRNVQALPEPQKSDAITRYFSHFRDASGTPFSDCKGVGQWAATNTRIYQNTMEPDQGSGRVWITLGVSALVALLGVVLLQG